LYFELLYCAFGNESRKTKCVSLKSVYQTIHCLNKNRYRKFI